MLSVAESVFEAKDVASVAAEAWEGCDCSVAVDWVEASASSPEVASAPSVASFSDPVCWTAIKGTRRAS